MPCSQDDGCLAFLFFSLFFIFSFFFSFVQNILRSQELRLVQHARWNDSRDNKDNDEGGLERCWGLSKADVLRQRIFLHASHPNARLFDPRFVYLDAGDWTMF